MDLITPRNLLKTKNNPNKAIDYIVTLETISPDNQIRISLRYIPDKDIVDSDCFETYIQALFEYQERLEGLASFILEDINNEIVARWVQIIAFEDKGNTAQHSVVLEDRQPQWDNPHLLARITTI